MGTPQRIESRLAIAINGMLWLGGVCAGSGIPKRRGLSGFSGCNGKWSFSDQCCTASVRKRRRNWHCFPDCQSRRYFSWNVGPRGFRAWACGDECLDDRFDGRSIQASGHHPFYHLIAWTGAIYSCGIGIIFLFGISDRFRRSVSSRILPAAFTEIF